MLSRTLFLRNWKQIPRHKQPNFPDLLKEGYGKPSRQVIQYKSE